MKKINERVADDNELKNKILNTDTCSKMYSLLIIYDRDWFQTETRKDTWDAYVDRCVQ